MANNAGEALRSFDYNRTGDRTSMTVGGLKQTYLYDPANHHLSSTDGKLRRYDAAGNTIGIGDATLAYDAVGRLASANEQGRLLVTYGYNAADERIARTEAAGAKTSLILYDEAGHWLADYDSTGTITRQAVWMGDYLVGLVDGGKLLYVEPDHLGSPRAVIDPERKITLWRWRPSDDSFGAALPDEDPDADGTRFVFDLRFPGQRYDALTGLHYNYYRDYDPGAGRYIQVDPIGLAGGVNPYAYVSGDPLRSIDPEGLAPPGSVLSAHSWKQPPGLGGVYGKGVRLLPAKPTIGVEQSAGAWPSAAELNYTLVCTESRCAGDSCSRYSSSYSWNDYTKKSGQFPSTARFSQSHPGCTCIRMDFLDRAVERRGRSGISMPSASKWDIVEAYTRFLESRGRRR
ncbi:RHS repeat-associated core domain-containing protein [Luteibacter yeojuensis]